MHLAVLKKFYCEHKTLLVVKRGSTLLHYLICDSLQAYFKLAMLINYEATMQAPFYVNPLTKLWSAFDLANMHNYLECMKLARMVVVHVLGLV